ncbi:MAG: molybdenum cofactor synthesis domain-containing protein [Pseudomonadota bacterium]
MPIDQTRPFRPLEIAVITVSDSREAASDRSGDLLQGRLEKAGHRLCHRTLVKDEIAQITQAIKLAIAAHSADIVLTTGGTGVTARDVTPEALQSIQTKAIPGFGELFRMLSYQTIASSTIQSRACAGLVAKAYVFCLPGSPGACKDAWDMILCHQLDSRFRPCNFVELMPRL